MVFVLAWLLWISRLIFSTANEVHSSLQNTTSFCYVLAYVWTAEFCQESFPGCQRPLPYWISNFTMHGLWPQYTVTPGYPSYCTKEPFDPSVPLMIGLPLMKHYWPNVKVADNNPDYTSFWEHEWVKHGTCTGLSQKQYFQYGIELIQKFGSPSILAEAVPIGTIAAAKLRNALGGALLAALQCDEGKKLSGVFTCWTQSEGKPQKQIMCPTSVQKEDTCTDSILVVKHLSTNTLSSS